MFPPEGALVDQQATYWLESPDHWNMIYLKQIPESHQIIPFYCTFQTNLKTEEIRLWIQSLTGEFP